MQSKTHEPALVQAPARLRANVPSYRLRAASYVLRHGVAGSRGEPPSLPFLCRRFFSQTEKKCRNAGSVKSLIIVGREGSKPIINKSKLLYRLPPIADSRKGCLYKRSVIDSSRILCRSRGSGVSRSPHPTTSGSVCQVFLQVSSADDICPYRTLLHFSLLLITLNEAE